MAHLGTVLDRLGGIKLKMDETIGVITGADEPIHEAAASESQQGILLTNAFNTLVSEVESMQTQAVCCLENFEASLNDYEKGR